MDLIERQAAIDALDEQIALCNKALGSFDISMKDEYAVKVERASLKAYRETLNVLPSAQPELIRCKDCAEWRLASDGEGECYDGMADGAMTHETDFCSWARRRTDDQ